jgi:magnesium-transporting ATPase (P-type)
MAEFCRKDVRNFPAPRAVVEPGQNWSLIGSLIGLGKFPQEAAMNDAIHQLMQVILQGVTWVLRTIERLWSWSWSQIESAFNMSWGNLPVWKVVLGVIAVAVMVVIVVRILRSSLHAFKNIAEAFWTMVMAAFGVMALVVVAGLFSRGFVWFMATVPNDVFARLF